MTQENSNNAQANTAGNGSFQYVNQSRGYKTKGNTYKSRYVDKTCPDCQHGRAYEDVWKTRIAYTCLKRSCRHKWYEKKEILKPVQDVQNIEQATVVDLETNTGE